MQVFRKQSPAAMISRNVHTINFHGAVRKLVRRHVRSVCMYKSVPRWMLNENDDFCSKLRAARPRECHRERASIPEIVCVVYATIEHIVDR